MKKTLVALAVAGFASAAMAAPEAGSVYFGAKAGWSTAHHGINQSNTKYANDERYGAGLPGGKFGINRNSVTYGVFGGYQILDNLAAEVGYDYFGRVRGNGKTLNGEDARAFKHTAHGTTFSLKPSYEVANGLDLFGKVGLALVRNDYKLYDVDGAEATEKYHNFKPSLTLGGGVEYAVTPALAFRVEYQWLSKAGNYSKAYRKGNTNTGAENFTKYSPDFHSVTAGVTFRFGQGALPVISAEPEVVTKNFAFNSDVLFDFGKASLKAAASSELDRAYSEIVGLGLAEAAVQVNGYTDRLGSDAYNMKLSQNRAETVANYIVGKGANPANVTAVGYGKASPVTGNTCDAVKGRQALIACLAPDRRVEVQVQGSKQIVM